MRARLKILLTLCRPAAHAQFENFFLPDAVSKSTRFAGAASVTQWQDNRTVTTKSLFGSALDCRVQPIIHRNCRARTGSKSRRSTLDLRECCLIPFLTVSRVPGSWRPGKPGERT